MYILLKLSRFLVYFIFCVVTWSLMALYWTTKTALVDDGGLIWDPQHEVLYALISSITLDVILAGSEIFHKARLILGSRSSAPVEVKNDYEMQQLSQ